MTARRGTNGLRRRSLCVSRGHVMKLLRALWYTRRDRAGYRTPRGANKVIPKGGTGPFFSIINTSYVQWFSVTTRYRKGKLGLRLHEADKHSDLARQSRSHRNNMGD